MTRIIGHRGAAGLALENTIESFKKAFEAGVDIVELDVQLTRDGQFVVSHDANLKRVSGSWAAIASLDYADLKRIKLKNGEPVPLLSTVLNLVKREGKRVIVELKINQNLDDFCRLIGRYGDTVVATASDNLNALKEVREHCPEARLYIVERLNPFAALDNARRLRANGIDMNVWLLNPIVYWVARRRKLELMVYTVNWKLVQRFVQRLYPHVDICTNVPHKFMASAEAIEQQNTEPKA